MLASGKQASVTPAHITVSGPGDTEGTEINLAAAPKIEHGAPLEQDAGSVGTSRGHRGQQSYFWSATGPPGADAHSFIRLPASGAGDTHEDTKKRTHLHALPVDDPSAWDTSRLMDLPATASEMPIFPLFFCCHLKLFVFFVYERVSTSAACWRAS